MTRKLNPTPNGKDRADVADRVRREAATIADTRVPKPSEQNELGRQRSNREAETLTPPWGTFTKGLPHGGSGEVSEADLMSFVEAFNQFKPSPFDLKTPFPGTYDDKVPAAFDANIYKGKFTWPLNPDGPQDMARGWESPLSGHAFEINGPDPDQVAMPPAPKIGSAELVAEMAEVYGMALVRDKAFPDWDGDPDVGKVVEALAATDFYKSATGLDARERRRRKARSLDTKDGKSLTLDADLLFRGSTPGAQVGPYISQFLLLGNAERPSSDGTPPKKKTKVVKGASMAERADVGTVAAGTGETTDAQPRAAKFVPQALRVRLFQIEQDAAKAAGKTLTESAGGSNTRPIKHYHGYVQYGAQYIDQRVYPHAPRIDHMTDWASWLDIQNGADRKGFDLYDTDTRFIHTPRDLATYVHFDALYQAYLNACLFLLGEGAPTDAGLPEGKGNPTRDAFATFGGPHILTLVTEVATRALKAVRRQKFNIHLRARPEAIAGGVALAWTNKVKGGLEDALGDSQTALTGMVDDLHDLLKDVATHNGKQNTTWGDNGWPVDIAPLTEETNGLLPMAFPEGSPMHGSYGAGHATVAGACVTVLKAFFEMYDGVDRGDVKLRSIMKSGGGGRYPETLFETPLLLAGGAAKNLKAEYVTAYDGKILDKYKGAAAGTLTVEGELDKLAANISIGRDFAGVHYYTDYYESLRMGERIAVGMLQEQMMTYREPVTMRFTSFDGDRIMLVGTGGSEDLDDTPVYVWNDKGKGGRKRDFRAWWTRAMDEAGA